MNTSVLNFLAGFIFPLFIVVAFVYWTIKISYQKRFIPTLTVIFLAILAFFLPFLLATLDVIDKGFGAGILSIYFSGFLGLGVLVNIIVATSIKKKKESNNKL
ncbi:hypothetical protein [Rossellomorea sp. LjRoot5]|uniref:hypothetical protein n=1 Tax=Rossellomorea sp. LjRoot5 TaxID=3342331 RepID=UPI003ECCDCD9